jgi:hypothetical protein
MSGYLPQTHFTGKRSLQSQQQSFGIGMNRSHQGHLDDIAGHGQGIPDQTDF